MLTLQMNIDFERDGDVYIVRLQGRFHAGLDPEYMTEKANQIKALGASKMIADIREVSAMGSSGIGFVVSLYSSVMKNAGGRFIIAGATPRVAEVFKLTNLAGVIPSAATVESAIAELR